MNATRLLAILASVTLAMAVATATAFGHVERSSYWPDPAPDKSVKPAAGGKIPKARSLASALRAKPPGKTRVVCQRASLKKAIRSINSARKKGTVLRPSQGTKKLTAKQARKLKRLNRAFYRRCKFKSIQTAIKKSRNNDRVVIMPGKYLEPKSRAKPTDDPKCAQYKEESDDGQGAATYRYQAKCPNDQNLIYLQGRALTDEPVPFPPRENRRGIPDEGPCIRCNVQIEGTGAKPEDVVIDLAKDTKAKLRGPSDPLKEVGLRVDRADGTVIKNLTAAHAAEHGIYIHETDGYLMTEVKFFYNKEYGGLMFASDHGLTQRLRGRGPWRLGHLPGRRARHGRADHGADAAREQHDHALRHPPQHARLLGDDGQRDARREQRLLRQRHRHRHGLVLRGRPPGLPAGRRHVREQPHLLEQLQQLRGGFRRGAEGPGPGGRGHLHRRRQRQRDPRQPHLGQLAPRDDADQRAGLVLRELGR